MKTEELDLGRRVEAAELESSDVVEGEVREESRFSTHGDMGLGGEGRSEEGGEAEGRRSARVSPATILAQSYSEKKGN